MCLRALRRSWSSDPSLRKWRNWQTHQLEGLALARAWGFESPLPHHSTRLLRDPSMASPSLSHVTRVVEPAYDYQPGRFGVRLERDARLPPPYP